MKSKTLTIDEKINLKAIIRSRGNTLVLGRCSADWYGPSLLVLIPGVYSGPVDFINLQYKILYRK